MLMYADDMALFASSQADLTQLLHTLEGMLSALGLSLNIAKCKIVPISRPAIPLSTVCAPSSRGELVPVSSETKLLGLMVHRQPVDNQSCRWISERLRKCSTSATAFLVHARAIDLQLSASGYLRAMRAVVVGLRAYNSLFFSRSVHVCICNLGLSVCCRS